MPARSGVPMMQCCIAHLDCPELLITPSGAPAPSIRAPMDVCTNSAAFAWPGVTGGTGHSVDRPQESQVHRRA